jgi:hypothetical protein
VSETFDIKGYPKDPVTAGTPVRLVTNGDSEMTSTTEWRTDWTVVGPRSTDRHDFPDRGPNLDFVPPEAGAYSVTATRTPKQTPPPTGGPAENGGGAPPSEPVEPLGGLGAGQPGAGGSLPVPRQPGQRTNGTTTAHWEITALAPSPVGSEGNFAVSLQRTAVAGTPDQVLWSIIRNRTQAIGFRRYSQFIDGVMCRAIDVRTGGGTGRGLTFTGTQAYQVLKQATDAFLMQECGILLPDNLCSSPVAPLDPALVEAELGGDSPDARRFLAEEPRRLGRKGVVSVADLRSLRDLYFEQIEQDGTVALPYLRIIREKLADLPLKSPGEQADNCYGILRARITGPLAIELIWSYWHEEAMLVQALHVILARFQNRRLASSKDPLSRFDLDPLRPLANLLWGFAEDEMHRLTVRRRAFEYDHEYGLSLLGRAVPDMRTVDRRSRFVESFHALLHSCAAFFTQDDDTTVIADAFPLLNALRETHLILSEGAHNQYGDLPSAARAEMLIMQWLLARPEMRDYLGGRVMVPYEEAWMDRVDTMNQIQGWSQTSVTHPRDLGVFGEQLLLGIRYGNWSVVNDPQQAANWARYWRPEIQRYTHAYRAATGADLTAKVDTTLPARLLRARLNGSKQPVYR